MFSSRQKKLLNGFDMAWKCMEIGPGYNPLLPKRDGWNVLSVDHTDRSGLVEKYSRVVVDAGAIEDVDVVWNGGPLDKAVPECWHGMVDGCVASHVIEHIPNPIVFFLSMAIVLRPSGLLSLAIPDKRYCFDFFQPLTATGDWLHAWKRGAEVHSQRAIFQQMAYAVRANGLTTWDQGAFLHQIELLTPTLTAAFDRFSTYSEEKGAIYEDCHAWHFTPSSFLLMLLELSQLGLVPFSVAQTLPSSGCEFFVILRNVKPTRLSQNEFTAQRVALLRQMVEEQAESARLLRPGCGFSLRRCWYRLWSATRRRLKGN